MPGEQFYREGPEDPLVSEEGEGIHPGADREAAFRFCTALEFGGDFHDHEEEVSQGGA